MKLPLLEFDSPIDAYVLFLTALFPNGPEPFQPNPQCPRCRATLRLGLKYYDCPDTLSIASTSATSNCSKPKEMRDVPRNEKVLA